MVVYLWPPPALANRSEAIEVLVTQGADLDD